jgi:CDGSH-type Zn-finger protein
MHRGNTMSEDALIAQKEPYAVELDQGRTYYWCACGRSKAQPFCDGSHQGTGLEPLAFTAEKSGTAYLCGCKRTVKPPFCDGTHNSL